MVRFRIQYRKTGTVRYTSHRDAMRVFRRSLATGRVPVCYSQGFNPHPLLSFGPSLRTGWEGLAEYMDVTLDRTIDDLQARCNATLPEGIEVVESARVERSVPRLSADISAARYEVEVALTDVLDGQNAVWAEFCGNASRTRAKTSDRPDPLSTMEEDARHRFGPSRGEPPTGRDIARPTLLEIKVLREDGVLRIDYLSTMRHGKSLFPEELLHPYVGDARALEIPAKVVRTALYVERGGAYHSPISKGVVQNLL